MTAVTEDGGGGMTPALPRQGEEDRSVALAERVRAARPPLYKVVLLNDDYTPMEFVVAVLMEVFNKSKPEAVRIMLLVHQTGSGVGGVYPRDIADSKALRVIELARRAEHPLQCRLERA